MTGVDFDGLRAAHVEMLSGTLIDGTVAGPNKAGYAWSRVTAEPALNFAYGVRHAIDFAWAGAVALGRGREPAFLARDTAEVSQLRALFEPAAIRPLSWMIAATGRPARRPAPEPRRIADRGACRVAAHPGARPPADFETVLMNVSAEASERAHLRRHRLPALRSARVRPGIAPLHLVLHDPVGPAACASLYLRGALAGLYNLATRADRQRRGLGARIVVAALEAARERGAAEVFLSCPEGGTAEAPSLRTGFRPACRPRLVCIGPP